MKPIVFLAFDQVLMIHEEVLLESGGLPGICPDKSLEAALDRVHNHIMYSDFQNVYEIAALYGFSLAQGHIFNDGNKRTAMMAIYQFLALNGIDLEVSSEEIVETMVALAEKKFSLYQLTYWLKIHSIERNNQLSVNEI